MKRCSKCGLSKPLSAFRPRKSSRDGLHCWCDPCYRSYYSAAMRRWRATNPERELENQRRWREQNPEASHAAQERYNAKTPTRKRDYMRKRRAQDPETVRATYRRWRAANHEQELLRLATRRALTEATPALKAFVAGLLAQPCAYCEAEENITVDHVVPLSRGGRHEAGNLAPACRSCNSSKCALLLDEWAGPPALRSAA